MNHPKVTIISPTYNRLAYLEYAIQSVLKQTYSSFEYIIIDDGSTDGTKRMVDSYLDDDRIRYFYKQNEGQSIARNSGLEKARGDYICFLDSDDSFLPDKLAFQIETLEIEKSYHIIHGDEYIIDENNNVVSDKNMSRYSGRIYKQLLKDNSISIGTVMVRKECFEKSGGFNPLIKVADDYELWLRFSVKYNFLYIPKYFAQYRIMDDQISSNKDKRFKYNQIILEKFMQDNPGLLSKKEENYYWSFFYSRRGKYRTSKKKAMQDFIKSLCFHIRNKTAWKLIFKLLIK